LKPFLENNKIIKGNKAAGVEYYLKASGEVIINVAIIKTTSKGPVILNSFDGLSSPAEVQKITKNLPVVISIEGKGVIHKKAIRSNVENYVEKVFPNASNGQFYIQEYNITNTEVYLSLTRKDVIDSVLLEFTKNKTKVVDVILGPFTTEQISQGPEIETFFNKITFDRGKVSIIEKNENPLNSFFTYQNNQLNIKTIVAFSNALNYFNNSVILTSNIDTLEFKKEYLYSRNFILGSYIFLGAIFFILFINFFLFTHFREKESLLQQQLDFNSGLSKRLENLKTEFNLKQEMLQKSGILRKTKISFFIDQVVQVMPANIRIRSISYHPVKQKIKLKEEIQYNTGKIIIAGVSLSSSEVNKWLNGIKKLKWVSDIEINNYSQEEFDKPGEFILFLTYIPK